MKNNIKNVYIEYKIQKKDDITSDYKPQSLKKC